MSRQQIAFHAVRQELQRGLVGLLALLLEAAGEPLRQAVAA